MAPDDPSINICFSTTDALVSRFIRWATRSVVSHALVTYRSETLGRVMVLEAVGHGFVMLPWKRWRQRNSLVARFALRCDAPKQYQALHLLTGALGAQYDGLSLIGFLLRRWRKRTRNPFDNAGKLICSEAVAALLNHAEVPGFDDPGQWTPEDLLQHALLNPAEFHLIEHNAELMDVPAVAHLTHTAEQAAKVLIAAAQEDNRALAEAAAKSLRNPK